MNNFLRNVAGFISFAVPIGLIAVASSQSHASVLRLVLGVLGLLLVLAYVIYTFRSASVPLAKRGLWAMVLLLGNIFALPFFWVWYVRPRA
jgi:hypothetical protein